jgi:hypothetical protein
MKDLRFQASATFSQTPPSGRVVRIITGLGVRPGTGEKESGTEASRG